MVVRVSSSLWFVPLLAGLCGCEDFLDALSEGGAPNDTGGAEDTADTGEEAAPTCIAEGTFGTITCDRFYTSTEVANAFALGWIDNEGDIAELEIESVEAREEGEDWQENAFSVFEHSTTESGNTVIGLTIPGAPRDEATIKVYGKFWLTDGTSVDLCDLETGLVVENNGVDVDGYSCTSRFYLDY